MSRPRGVRTALLTPCRWRVRAKAEIRSGGLGLQSRSGIGFQGMRFTKQVSPSRRSASRAASSVLSLRPSMRVYSMLTLRPLRSW